MYVSTSDAWHELEASSVTLPPELEAAAPNDPSASGAEMLGALVTTPQPLIDVRAARATKTDSSETRHATSACGTARSQREDKGARIMPRDGATGEHHCQGTQSGPARFAAEHDELGGQAANPPSPTTAASLPASTTGPESTTPASARAQAGWQTPGIPMFWAGTGTSIGALPVAVNTRGFGYPASQIHPSGHGDPPTMHEEEQYPSPVVGSPSQLQAPDVESSTVPVVVPLEQAAPSGLLRTTAFIVQ